MMIDIIQMSKEELLEKSTIAFVLTAKSEIERQQQENAYLERCRQLKVKSEAMKLLSAYKKDLKGEIKDDTGNNTLHFDNQKSLKCGMWIADMSGVKVLSDKGGYRRACYHPILPTKRLFNLETKTEKIKLEYFKDHEWKDIIVDKEIVASNSKIVKLASYGISVTSETSKNLVAYLADVENLNDIEKSQSTSKLGWIGAEFLPFDTKIIFDDESRFKSLIDSIHMVGSENLWFDLVKKIRKNTTHYEPQLVMSASFASVLISKLNMLPFIVNLWGKTGGGKTVTLMLACSIWADPAEGKYITDSYATQNAFEARLDVLNNFPLLMDDLSKVRDRLNDGFTDLVYLLCSGKGKERSNIDLGLNKSKSWSCTIISNMERPLANDTMRGGAINRILDIEMAGGNIFENGNAVVQTIKENYGFAGYAFVEIVKNLGYEAINGIRKEFEEKIKAEAAAQESDKEEKQILPLSVVLTADYLATKYIFKDDIYLDLKTMVSQLKDVEDVSEGKRAYEAILDYANVYRSKFQESDYSPENWGFIKDGYINITPLILKKIAAEQNFSIKAFCSWANENHLLRANSKNQNVLKVNDIFQRFYTIKQDFCVDVNESVNFEDCKEPIPFDIS